MPIELVVSLGTGNFDREKQKQRSSFGWGKLVGQLIASSTDTEDVHAVLGDFLPRDKYFRLNPSLERYHAIDEKSKDILLGLKKVAKDSFRDMETGREKKRLATLVRALRGK